MILYKCDLDYICVTHYPSLHYSRAITFVNKLFSRDYKLHLSIQRSQIRDHLYWCESDIASRRVHIEQRQRSKKKDSFSVSDPDRRFDLWTLHRRIRSSNTLFLGWLPWQQQTSVNSGCLFTRKWRIVTSKWWAYLQSMEYKSHNPTVCCLTKGGVHTKTEIETDTKIKTDKMATVPDDIAVSVPYYSVKSHFLSVPALVPVSVSLNTA